MNRPKLFRALRIIWSVAWGLLALLLVALWVRSLSYSDSVVKVIPKSPGHRVTSFNGYIEYRHSSYYAGPERFEWGLREPPEHAPILWHKPSLGFAFSPRGFVVPYWLPLLFTATLATLPWLQWRFSLRTLLLATTLVAVVLGLIAYAERR